MVQVHEEILLFRRPGALFDATPQIVQVAVSALLAGSPGPHGLRDPFPLGAFHAGPVWSRPVQDGQKRRILLAARTERQGGKNDSEREFRRAVLLWSVPQSTGVFSVMIVSHLPRVSRGREPISDLRDGQTTERFRWLLPKGSLAGVAVRGAWKSERY